MRAKPRLTIGLDGDLKAPRPIAGEQALKTVVKEALLNILSDESASAAAKASAGRTLLEYFSEADQGLSAGRGADMTAAELDSAIAGFARSRS